MEKTRAKETQEDLYHFLNTQTMATDGGSLEPWALVSAVLAPDLVVFTPKSAIMLIGLLIQSIILKIITNFMYFAIKEK